MTRFITFDGPLGPVRISGDGEIIAEVHLGASGDERGDPGVFRDAVTQLRAYFAGELTTFDLRLAARGTLFQHAVWGALAEIPFGTTMSYAQIAARVGAPSAARAVGTANARNPIAIVVPCHRVIGASGALTGYAGGIDRKRWLLDHETVVARAVVQRSDVFSGSRGPVDVLEGTR